MTNTFLIIQKQSFQSGYHNIEIFNLPKQKQKNKIKIFLPRYLNIFLIFQKQSLEFFLQCYYWASVEFYIADNSFPLPGGYVKFVCLFAYDYSRSKSVMNRSF